MIRFYKSFLFIGLLFFSGRTISQNIHGTWEGEMNNELLRISVEQKGQAICGFTHDYVLGDTSNNCTAAYAGKYLSEHKLWLLTGTYFIKNSGTHVLMKLVLWQDARVGPNRLLGRVTTGSSFGDLADYGAYEVLLTRVSNKPIKFANGEPNCFPKPVRKPKPVTTTPAPQPKPVTVQPKPQPKPVTVQPKPQPRPVQPTPDPIIKKDTPKKPLPVTTKPVSKPDAELVRSMIERKQTRQSTLEVNVKQINLKVYDNGDIDNDTVSIFYNGKLLLSHQRLSDKPIVINLDLDENVTEHKLVMYAENLGGIPPNTALIVVTAGDKRYELRSRANLEENAVLVFEYKPK